MLFIYSYFAVYKLDYDVLIKNTLVNKELIQIARILNRTWFTKFVFQMEQRNEQKKLKFKDTPNHCLDSPLKPMQRIRILLL